MATFPGSTVTTRPLRIFVVEDHAETAKYLCLYLEMIGHRVTCAGSMAQALDKLPKTGCDVFLCDIVLPDGSGWELLPLVDMQLRQPTFAVAFSGCVLATHRDKSEQAGFLHHLNKPIDPVMLGAVLDEAAELLASFSRDGTAPFEDMHRA